MKEFAAIMLIFVSLRGNFSMHVKHDQGFVTLYTKFLLQFFVKITVTPHCMLCEKDSRIEGASDFHDCSTTGRNIAVIAGVYSAVQP